MLQTNIYDEVEHGVLETERSVQLVSEGATPIPLRKPVRFTLFFFIVLGQVFIRVLMCVVLLATALQRNHNNNGGKLTKRRVNNQSMVDVPLLEPDDFELLDDNNKWPLMKFI